MNGWKKYAFAAVAAAVAGLAYHSGAHKNTPVDFRDAPADTAPDGREIPEPAAAEAAGAVSAPAVEWVAIPGGEFVMGTDIGGKGFEDAGPSHTVTVKTFKMSRSAVTVAQYKECVDAHKCPAPAPGDYCNWGVEGRELHPINCVTWEQANRYAGFKGGRLPSEAEWEYAAKSGGKKGYLYPWGNESPSCAKAVMYGEDNFGCGKGSTWPVCLKPEGNTGIEGLPAGKQLCDMAGNVWQWTLDRYQPSYAGGTAGAAGPEARVIRGGSFLYTGDVFLRADHRSYAAPGSSNGSIGFRIAKDARKPFLGIW
ncbi:MAG: SUMF1/EgtB/PvdO family nonheme iron enzyme [Elusimicrobiales bacterium]|jgi:formylglycine-generating enzyme required for sulfatase activity